ncbi:hypothetical protein A8F94_05890 [Bacillus sp. FJAT-27225]|uniref:VOC family protein n=1 Tax=Bacillus sp. FJAT-27225 TaxID=1743144 RepID=UPI00080C3558|nr:VOC family protein [Bacillus sp. FJAT-27225]OCA91386.1 hypothetical protein A8F94_05890 [Bacillus sp. FJAT-27225]
MKFKWDHTIHHVNSLEKSIERFAENGLKAFMGGSHTNWGTYNALSYFGLCYIEFLSVENREIAQGVKEPILFVHDCLNLLPGEEVFGRIALRTDDMEEAAFRFRNEGLDVSEIMDGKRVNAAGQLIEWQLLMIKGNFNGLPYPFLIKWKQPDEERHRNLTVSGFIHSHPSGSVDVSRAIFKVGDPYEVSCHWSKLFGFPVQHLDTNTSILTVGSQSFLFKKGTANHLTELQFRTDNPEYKGKTFTLGKANYSFS